MDRSRRRRRSPYDLTWYVSIFDPTDWAVAFLKMKSTSSDRTSVTTSDHVLIDFTPAEKGVQRASTRSTTSDRWPCSVWKGLPRRRRSSFRLRPPRGINTCRISYLRQRYSAAPRSSAATAKFGQFWPTIDPQTIERKNYSRLTRVWRLRRSR